MDNSDHRQVMSPRGARMMTDRRDEQDREQVPNGVPAPPPQGPQDMDGETVTVSALGNDPVMRSMRAQPPRLSDGTAVLSDTAAPSSSRVTASSTSAHGFLMGPQAEQPRPAQVDTSEEVARSSARASFLGGVAKAVQSIPAAVEGFVLGHGSSGPSPQNPAIDVEGFASAQSGSPDDSRRPPSATQLPATPLLDDQTLQRLNGMQAMAPHLYGPEAPSSGVRPPSTSSSDIQAEVRRQMREFMAMRDEENKELRTRVDLLMSENRTLRQEISSQLYSQDLGPRPGATASSGRFSRLEWIGRGFGNLLGGAASPKPMSPPDRDVDLRPPPAPPPPPQLPYRPTHTGQLPQALRLPENQESFKPEPPRPSSTSTTTGQALGLGAQANPVNMKAITDPPVARVLDFDTAGTVTAPTEAHQPDDSRTTHDPLNVVLTGMAQLQGVVADLAGSPKQVKQEVIKPGVSSLPPLPAAGPESCLQFADWLHSSKPALSDISDTSEELWSLVLSEAGDWYSKYLRLDAISRLTSKPIPSAEVTQPKWARVSRRIETMIISASPSAIRDELSAARVTGLLPVVARLYVIYAPGGLNERELGLKHIQEPSSGTTVKDTVDLLRRWQRWCDRMKELGGTLPDSAIRVKALERITKAVLQTNPDVAFRVNLTRAALQIDSTPDDGKVDQL